MAQGKAPGRAPARAQLGVWMNGERVGTWTSGNATPTFEYADSWLQSVHCRPLSLSLPITSHLVFRGERVESFFDNLLPDNADIRRRIRQRFHAKSSAAFDLLYEIGRDCVGAVQLLPLDMEPADVRSLQWEPLTEAEIEDLLRNLTAPRQFGSDAAEPGDFRISIAGAQEKTSLLWRGGTWCRPVGPTPTTHILKLPLGEVTQYRADFRTSVENEWVCGRIIEELGLPAARSAMLRFGETKVLAVERFDRSWVPAASPHSGSTGAYLVRIPQEDLCQATGTPPRLKYERDGGPGMARCLEVLGGSESPLDARSGFVLAQLAFWLMAATDGHAKNFSIFLNRGGTYTPTPLYDVLSAWPVIGKGARLVPYQNAKLAMAVRAKNAHYVLGDIEARHWKQLALVAGGRAAWSAMLTLVEGVDAALQRVERMLPADFPPQVWQSISAGMLRHKKKFLAGAMGL